MKTRYNTDSFEKARVISSCIGVNKQIKDMNILDTAYTDYLANLEEKHVLQPIKILIEHATLDRI